MRLFGLFTVAYVAAGREPIESGLCYKLSGWNPKCDKMPVGCTNGASDVVELNSCLIDQNLGCPSTLDVTVAMNAPKFSIIRTNNGEYTIVFTLQKPLFPGGWTLSSGTITHKPTFFPPFDMDNLDNSTLVYKQGLFKRIDFDAEDLSKWPRLNCNIKTPQEGSVEVINHHFKCSDQTPELLKNATEITFAIVKDGKPVTYEGLDSPTGDMILHRTTRASKISQISESNTKYVLEWPDECKDVPDNCRDVDLTKQEARKCIETYRKPGCEVGVGAFIKKLPLNPIELRINGADALVEGVYIDPRKVLLIDMDPKLKWRVFETGYGFPAIDADDANIYVSPNLGDFSGKLDDVLLGDEDEQLFDDDFNISQPGGKFIYLDRPFSRSWIPMFKGLIGIVTEPTILPTTLNTTKSIVKKSLRGQQGGDI